MVDPNTFILKILVILSCFLGTSSQLVTRMCADQSCRGTLSIARALAQHESSDPTALNFPDGKDIRVTTKLDRPHSELWGGEINGKFGYFPKTFVKEFKVLNADPQHRVPTENIPLSIRQKFEAAQESSSQEANASNQPTKSDNEFFEDLNRKFEERMVKSSDSEESKEAEKQQVDPTEADDDEKDQDHGEDADPTEKSDGPKTADATKDGSTLTGMFGPGTEANKETEEKTDPILAEGADNMNQDTQNDENSQVNLKKKLQEEHLAKLRNNFLRRRLHQHVPQRDTEIDDINKMLEEKYKKLHSDVPASTSQNVDGKTEENLDPSQHPPEAKDNSDPSKANLDDLHAKVEARRKSQHATISNAKVEITNTASDSTNRVVSNQEDPLVKTQSAAFQEEQPGADQQVEPGARQQEQPGARQQEQPDARQQVQPGARQQSQPDARQKIQPGARQQVQPDARQQVQPDARQQGQPDARQTQPGAGQQVQPGAGQQVQPGAGQQGQPDAPQQVQPDAPQQVQPDAPQQVQPDARQQGQPEAQQQGQRDARQVQPGAGQKVQPGAGQQVQPGAGQQGQPGAEQVQPDAGQQIQSGAGQQVPTAQHGQLNTEQLLSEGAQKIRLGLNPHNLPSQVNPSPASHEVHGQHAAYQQMGEGYPGNPHYHNGGFPGDPRMMPVDPHFGHLHRQHMHGHGGPHQYPVDPRYANAFAAHQHADPRYNGQAHMHQNLHPYEQMIQMGQFAQGQMNNFEHVGEQVEQELSDVEEQASEIVRVNEEENTRVKVAIDQAEKDCTKPDIESVHVKEESTEVDEESTQGDKADVNGGIEEEEEESHAKGGDTEHNMGQQQKIKDPTEAGDDENEEDTMTDTLTEDEPQNENHDPTETSEEGKDPTEIPEEPEKPVAEVKELDPTEMEGDDDEEVPAEDATEKNEENKETEEGAETDKGQTVQDLPVKVEHVVHERVDREAEKSDEVKQTEADKKSETLMDSEEVKQKDEEVMKDEDKKQEPIKDGVKERVLIDLTAEKGNVPISTPTPTDTQIKQESVEEETVTEVQDQGIPASDTIEKSQPEDKDLSESSGPPENVVPVPTTLENQVVQPVESVGKTIIEDEVTTIISDDVTTVILDGTTMIENDNGPEILLSTMVHEQVQPSANVIEETASQTPASMSTPELKIDNKPDLESAQIPKELNEKEQAEGTIAHSHTQHDMPQATQQTDFISLGASVPDLEASGSVQDEHGSVKINLVTDTESVVTHTGEPEVVEVNAEEIIKAADGDVEGPTAFGDGVRITNESTGQVATGESVPGPTDSLDKRLDPYSPSGEFVSRSLQSHEPSAQANQPDGEGNVSLDANKDANVGDGAASEVGEQAAPVVQDPSKGEQPNESVHSEPIAEETTTPPPTEQEVTPSAVAEDDDMKPQLEEPAAVTEPTPVVEDPPEAKEPEVQEAGEAVPPVEEPKKDEQVETTPTPDNLSKIGSDFPSLDDNPSDPYATDFVGRKVPEDESETVKEEEGESEGWLVWYARHVDSVIGILDPVLIAVVEMMPPSIQKFLEHEPFGMPKHRALLMAIGTTIMVGVISMTFACGGGSKKSDPRIAKYADMEEKYFIATKEKEGLEDALEKSTKEVERLKKRNGASEKSIEESKTELQTTKLHNSSLQQQVTELQEQLGQVQQTIEQWSASYYAKEAESQQYQAQVTTLTEAKDDLEKQLEEVKSYLDLTKTSSTDLETKVMELNEEISVMQQSKDQLQLEVETWTEKVDELKSQLKGFEKEKEELNEQIAFKDNELMVMKDCFKQLKTVEDSVKATKQPTENGEGSETDEEEEDEADGDTSAVIEEKISAMMDVSKVSAQLKAAEEERDQIRQRYTIEIDQRKELEDEMAELRKINEKLQKGHKKAEEKSIEASTKLSVLQQYFKEKEVELQMQLGEQEVIKKAKASLLANKDETVKTMEMEMQMAKEKVDDLQTEISKVEKDYRTQIAMQEKKAHENWLAARQAERELKESKSECNNLRQRLVELERLRDMDAQPLGPGLIRPLPQRGMLPPDMMNGPPGAYRSPPPMDGRPGSRGSGSIHGPQSPPLFRDDFSASPFSDRPLPPPHMRPPPPGGAPFPPPLDRDGRPLPPLDRDGRPLPPLDRDGRPLPPLDRDGRPLPPLDRDGRPLPPLDRDGRPLPPLDRDGRPLPPPLDRNGRPLPPLDRDGRPMPPPFDRDGRPLPPPEQRSPPLFDRRPPPPHDRASPPHPRYRSPPPDLAGDRRGPPPPGYRGGPPPPPGRPYPPHDGRSPPPADPRTSSPYQGKPPPRFTQGSRPGSRQQQSSV